VKQKCAREQNGYVGEAPSDSFGLPLLGQKPTRVASEISNKQKNVTFCIKQDASEDGVFTGMASTFGNIDSDNDIIVEGAFTKSLQSGRKIRLLSQHNMGEPIGTITEVIQTSKGLQVTGKLTLEVQKAKEVRALIQDGAIDSFSIGFMINDSEFDNDRGVRLIKEADLFEVSIVTFPANDQAEIFTMKNDTTLLTKAASPFQEDISFAPSTTPWDGDAAVTRWRAFSDSVEAPSDDYFKGFLFWDAENPELFGSYKLPFVDIIGGKMVAVPRGLSAALGAIRGARGGIDIPESDREQIERNILRYQEMIQEPEEDSGHLDDEEEEKSQFKMSSLKEAESLLRTKGFSRKEATTFVSGLKKIAKQSESVAKEVEEKSSDSIDNEALLEELKDLNLLFKLKNL